MIGRWYDLDITINIYFCNFLQLTGIINIYIYGFIIKMANNKTNKFTGRHKPNNPIFKKVSAKSKAIKSKPAEKKKQEKVFI